MKKTMVCAWALAAAAWGAEGDMPPSWEVEIENAPAVKTSYAPGAVRVSTDAGTLTFRSEELASVEFPLLNQCVLTTRRGDRWAVAARPKLLGKMVEHAGLWENWDALKKVTFAHTGAPPAEVGAEWTVELRDGSRAGATFDWGAVRVQTAAGRFEVPAWMVVSAVQAAGGEQEGEWTVAIEPGGQGLRGQLAGSALRGKDRDGRALAIPWEEIARLVRAGREFPEGVGPVLEHGATFRMADGTEAAGRMPAALLTIRGEGGTWTVPTARVRKIFGGGGKAQVVRTTAGEWLAGTVEPARMPFAAEGTNAAVAWADCAEVELDNAPVEMPENHLSWRLASGDVLVGEWMDPAEEAAPGFAGVRVGGAAAEARVPRKTGSKWSAAKYTVRHWASGATLAMPAAALEAAQAASPERMPPAVPPAGPAAAYSDEVRVPGGTFAMGRAKGDGAEDETPPVEMSLAPFWIASTPTTVAQFGAFAAAARYATDAENTAGSATWRDPGFPQRPEDPVVCVTWLDAARYCNWLSEVSGLKPCYEFRSKGREAALLPGRNGYRLPLEAEWEYAARSGGREDEYPWGKKGTDAAAAGLANFRGVDGKEDPWTWTSPVKAFGPNALGLYDMGGNVWEWCQDVYREDAYRRLAGGEGLERFLNGDGGPNVRRAMRGGSYYNELEYLRCANREYGMERMGAPRVGFRVARSAEAVP